MSVDESPAAPVACCRLCGGDVEYKFSRQVLNKYRVAYSRCSRCGSLQTDEPYWIDEAYGTNISRLDTGAVQRNLENLVVCLVVTRVLGLRNVKDIGGGDGLLCRLLRDHDVNCYAQDRFAQSVYAQGYEHPNFASPDLVTAFEVVEHYATPRKDLEALFAENPTCVLLTTGLYSDQGEEWWYLASEAGQHVFFYSVQAIEMIAERFGYGARRYGPYVLLARPGIVSPLRSKLLGLSFRPRIAQLVRAYIFTRETPGVWRDFLEQSKRPDSSNSPDQ